MRSTKAGKWVRAWRSRKLAILIADAGELEGHLRRRADQVLQPADQQRAQWHRSRPRLRLRGWLTLGPAQLAALEEPHPNRQGERCVADCVDRRYAGVA